MPPPPPPDPSMSDDLCAPPVNKKASKKAAAQEFEDEFEVEEFEDDGEVAPSPSAAVEAGSTRAERFQRFLFAANNTVSLPTHQLRSKAPSQREIHNVLIQSSPEDLPAALEVIAKWRARGLQPMSEKTVALLARKLAAAAELDGGKTGVDVFTDRTRYGADVPADLSGLYGLFAKLSKPQVAAEAPAAVEPAAEGAEEAVESTPSSSSSSPSAADLAYSLYSTSLLHRPAETASNALVLLSTLAALARAGEVSSSRSAQLISQVQAAGEDALVAQAQALPRRWKDIVRMRSKAVADEMRTKEHAEVEWFAHLAESLQVATRYWARGRNQESSEQDIEAQNDDQLSTLHGKISSLRNVTTDIYQDSRSQNTLLDGTSNAMDSFKSSLANTSQRFDRLVRNRQGDINFVLVIPGAVVVLFFLWKLLGGSGKGGAPAAVQVR
ncbi:hypothetical protein JCM10213_000676 [Rhodosporidiobolus nylandii]